MLNQGISFSCGKSGPLKLVEGNLLRISQLLNATRGLLASNKVLQASPRLANTSEIGGWWNVINHRYDRITQIAGARTITGVINKLTYCKRAYKEKWR
jgi:hypothetical protein